MRLLSTEYRMLSISRSCCLERLHAESNFLARADCGEMRLAIGARRAPSQGYRDSGLVHSPFRDASIASRHHFRYCAGFRTPAIADQSNTRGLPASEKRQGRKSRSVVQRRCGVRYGDLAAGLELMRLDRSRCSGRFAVNRGWLHRGEGAIGTLHDGICGAKTGQCRGRTRACLRPAASQRGWQVS